MERSSHEQDFFGTLSHSDGLEEIDSFYANEELLTLSPPIGLEQEHETSNHDDFSTLMDDIDQLTAPEQQQAHVELALQENITKDDASSEQQLNSNLALTVPEQQQTHTELTLENNITQDHTSLEPPLGSDLDITNDLMQGIAPQHQQSQGAQHDMTPQQKGHEHVLSSEGKSSMIEEMRSEEEQIPLLSQDERDAAANVDDEIRFLGIALQDSGEVPHVDVQSQRVDLQTKLNAVVLEGKATEAKNAEDSREHVVTPIEADGAKKKRITRTTIELEQAEQEMFPDLPNEATEAVPIEATPPAKRNRVMVEPTKESDGAGTPAKKTKAAPRRSQRNVLAAAAESESTATQPKGGHLIGQREMRHLQGALKPDSEPTTTTQPKGGHVIGQREMRHLQGTHKPQWRGSSGRQTRAQTQKAADSVAPPADAVKKRRRGKGVDYVE